ncbi:hypothetical protein GCK32_005022 [Trichostrongylus colubriformis]|uniref:Uncharacterized protein n=1 Tax=Trichostrongylus colubriformis TaxID=6319 RepID=A0AAN8IHP4_TRICO
MQLATARQQNVHCEEENMAAQGKKQIADTPRRGLGIVKNMATPDRTLMKPATPFPKPTLQTVSSNLNFSESRRRLSELCSSQGALKSHSPVPQPLVQHRLDLSDDVIEECNFEEDRNESPALLPQSDVVLSEAENEAEYFQKLISEGYGTLYDISEEDSIESCGPENEPDDCEMRVDTPILTEDSQRFRYEKPDEEGLQNVKRYTLEEMENLFNTFNDVIIF